VDGLLSDATYHHVAVGCLVLKGGTAIGHGSVILCDPLHEAFPSWSLAGQQVVIDEVGGEQFVKRL
jgi:hypothetical protein